ncbi:MAG: hypothetical protein AAB307_05305 [Deltaproteobacteria bacterium]
MKRLLIAAALSLGIGLFAASDSQAVHKGAGDLTCGQCHTMHNSQGGASLGGNVDGSLILLRGAVTTRAEIHNFCLQCHSSNGTQALTAFQPHLNSAPKVLLDSVNIATRWDQNMVFSRIGSGGDFQYACGDGVSGVWNCSSLDGAGTALGRGHSLGATTVTPPGANDGALAAFTCTSCHDPHGTDNIANATINKFRNLRKTPTDSGAASVALDATAGNEHDSWVGGISGTFIGGGNYIPVNQSTGASFGVATAANNTIWPIFRGATLTGTPATDAANSNAYGGGADGLARWCATCHDRWHETNLASNQTGNDWRRHPVDNVLTDGTPLSGDGVTIFDSTTYVVTTAGQVLPVASASATNRVFYKTTNTSDKVFCFSCHYAHGGPYFDNLRWDYQASVASGDQVGNGVPSNRGCQLCHNRGG